MLILHVIKAAEPFPKKQFKALYILKSSLVMAAALYHKDNESESYCV